ITIRDCYAGIYLGGVGTATQPHDIGNQIISSSCSTYNSIGDPSVPNDIGGGASGSSAYGIWLQAQQNFVVKNTIIRNVSTSNSVGSVDGLVVASGKGTCEISNNIIRTLKRNNIAAGGAYILTGMRISHYATTTNIRIFNNSISELLTSYTGASTTKLLARGITFEVGGTLTTSYDLWNNSISIDGSTYPNGSTTCLEIQQGTLDTYTMKNNVFANFTAAQTGVAAHYCITTPQVNRIGSAATSSDYNDFYIANDQGTSGHVGLGATTNYSTLSNWQSGMSFHAGIDANSVSTDPQFRNNVDDLHLSGSSPLLGIGTTPPAYILTSDIWCQPLGSPYNIGYEGIGTTGIGDLSQQQFYLSDVAPNPFSSQISFSVMMQQTGKLKITLTNTIGQEVKVIYDGRAVAGKIDFSFAEMKIKSGIYLLKAEGDFMSDVKRVVCIK
ncbi:MAG: hypothetical protein ABI763_10415, partial [Bacteroidota bacterium]